MSLKMDQITWGDLQRHKESPGMMFDTTRLHKTRCQEVGFLTILSSSGKFPGVSSHSRPLDGHRLFLTCQCMFPRNRFIRIILLSNAKNYNIWPECHEFWGIMHLVSAQSGAPMSPGGECFAPQTHQPLDPEILKHTRNVKRRAMKQQP